MTFDTKRSDRTMMLDQPAMPLRPRRAIGISTRAVALNGAPRMHRPTAAIERYGEIGCDTASLDRELRNAASKLKHVSTAGKKIPHKGSFDTGHRRTGS